jgi:hypothetical protein
MPRPLQRDIEAFLRDWVARHVQFQPGLTNLPLEVDRLAARLTSDARALGISGGDLHRIFGHIDTYLTDCYSRAKEFGLDRRP